MNDELMQDVLRVEWTDGNGPYGNSTTYDVAAQPFYEDRDRCPPPCEDGLDGFDRAHLFGFRDARQMVRWFGADVIRELVGLGCRIVHYRVPVYAVRYGYKQVTFNPRRAMRVATVRG